MESSIRPAVTTSRMTMTVKPRTFSDPSDFANEIIAWMQSAPNMDSTNAYLEDSQRLHAEAFAKCFQSKEQVCRIIEQVRNEDFILLLLQYCTADRQQIRPSIELRLTQEYLTLRPQTNMMNSTTDLAMREKLAQYNEYKIRLIMKYFVEPFKKKLPVKVLIAWLALLPVDTKGGLNGGIYLYIKNDLLQQQFTMSYEILFGYLLADLVGSGNFTILFGQLSVENKVLAEMMVQYVLLRKCSIWKMFEIFTRKVKLAKIVDIAREVVVRLMARPLPQLVTELFTSYALPVVMREMMSQSINFVEGEKLIREIMQFPQCLNASCIAPKVANQMMLAISKNHIFQHMVLMQELFKLCMVPETSKLYVNHLETYIQKYRNGQFVQQNSSMPKDETNQGSVMGSQMGQQQSHEVVLQSMEFVGLPNIGNTCYINSMLHSLYFCRSFVHPFYRALPQDKSLIMMQKVYGELRKRDRTNLKTMMAELKAQLPEDFSGNFSQQDVMELGRFLIDKFTQTNVHSQVIQPELKKVFEMKIRETIMCPAGDIIEDRECTEYFMMLSFANPQLFSKIGTQSAVSNVTDLTKMIEGDFFLNTHIDSEFQCDKCKQTFHERLRLQRLVKMPDLLIIVFSRFSYDAQNNLKRKVCDRVKMENYLIFGYLTNNQKQDNYKLIAFINHMGKNAESGHYQAYVRHPRDDLKWLNFDDEFITQSPYSKVADLVNNFSQYDSPYVLFYERI